MLVDTSFVCVQKYNITEESNNKGSEHFIHLGGLNVSTLLTKKKKEKDKPLALNPVFVCISFFSSLSWVSCPGTMIEI